jgi:hypothetical protein
MNDSIENIIPPKPSDPFDPASLRIDLNANIDLGVKKPIIHVPVGKAGKQEYFRIHPSQEYRIPMAILELKEQREVYAVSPAVATALPGETRIVELRTCITRSGNVFLWPVPLPSADGRELPWHTTAREAAERAETNWVRMVANMSAGHYDIWVAPPGIIARITTYLVQSFMPGKGASLKADKPVVCQSAEAARRMAEKLVPSKLGVVAYANSGDPDTGDYDEEPEILFRAGRLPDQFAG